MDNMIRVLLKGEKIADVRNWDTGLRVCANHVKFGANVKDLQIVRPNGENLPVTIKHLTI